MTMPALPAEGEFWWYTKRQAFDDAVRTALEGRLSQADLDAAYAALIHEHVAADVTDFEDAVNALIAATPPAGGLSSLSEIGTLITALVSGAGLDMPIAYATAFALGDRPAAPTNWKFRIYGGTLSDPDPAWMAGGDYRQITAS